MCFCVYSYKLNCLKELLRFLFTHIVYSSCVLFSKASTVTAYVCVSNSCHQCLCAPVSWSCPRVWGTLTLYVSTNFDSSCVLNGHGIFNSTRFTLMVNNHLCVLT